MADETGPAQITAAVGALEVLGPTRYTWLGEPFDLPEAVRRLAPPEGLRAAMTQALQWRLYADFFTSGAPVSPRPHAARIPRGAFAAALSEANQGAGALETGWRYAGRDGGRMMVERLGLRLWATPAEVVGTGPRAPEVGDLVAVRMAKEAPRLSPGFYMALSDVGLDPQRPRLLDRFYFHIRSDAAAECVALVTRRLNAAALPFRLKILDDPTSFGRCDTAVLSMQRRQRAESLGHIEALYDGLRPGLDDGTPALTRGLAPGLAFAEDPGDGVSFGAQRCGLIAGALVEAFESGCAGSDDRMEFVRAHMERAGTTPEAPYLGPSTAGEPRAIRPPHQQEVSSCP